MSKLPQISASKCINALQRVGFYVVRQRGSHIIPRRDDPYKRLFIPNHKTLKKGMLSDIIKDAGLSVDEFIDLI